MSRAARSEVVAIAGSGVRAGGGSAGAVWMRSALPSGRRTSSTRTRRRPTSQSIGVEPAAFLTRSSGVPPTRVSNCSSLIGNEVSGV